LSLPFVKEGAGEGIDWAGLDLASAVSSDVRHLIALVEHDLGDKEAPMATLRILLTAHHRNPVLRHSTLQPRESGTELLAGRNPAVQDITLVVIEDPILWTTTQLMT